MKKIFNVKKKAKKEIEKISTMGFETSIELYPKSHFTKFKDNKHSNFVSSVLRMGNSDGHLLCWYYRSRSLGSHLRRKRTFAESAFLIARWGPWRRCRCRPPPRAPLMSLYLSSAELCVNCYIWTAREDCLTSGPLRGGWVPRWSAF